jgi:hypothetical protein
MNVELARAVADEATRLHLSDLELAALTGTSIPTVRNLKIRGQVSRFERCRRGFDLFLQRARRAKTRADLGLAP